MVTRRSPASAEARNDGRRNDVAGGRSEDSGCLLLRDRVSLIDRGSELLGHHPQRTSPISPPWLPAYAPPPIDRAASPDE